MERVTTDVEFVLGYIVGLYEGASDTPHLGRVLDWIKRACRIRGVDATAANGILVSVLGVLGVAIVPVREGLVLTQAESESFVNFVYAEGVTSGDVMAVVFRAYDQVKTTSSWSWLLDASKMLEDAQNAATLPERVNAMRCAFEELRLGLQRAEVEMRAFGVVDPRDE